MSYNIKNRIIVYFENEKSLSRKELFMAMLKDFPNLKESTINVYITKLKKEGVIKNPLRGFYMLDKKELFSSNSNRD